MGRINKDRLAGICFFVLGICIAIAATQIQVRPNTSGPSGRLFPDIAAYGMMVCGIGMFLSGKNKNPKDKEEAVDVDSEKIYLDQAGRKRLLLLGGAFVIYYLALEWIGFVISTPFMLYAFIAILGIGKGYSKKWAALLAVLFTAILYLFFNQLFGIFLPSGKLF